MNKLKEIEEAKKCVRLGVKAQEKCNLKEALALFNEATKINPNCIKALEYKAVLLEKFGKYKEAKKCYKKLVEYCHKDFKSLIDNDTLYSCILIPKIKIKDRKKELKHIEELLEKHSRNIKLWLIKVNIMEYLYGNAKALELADELIERFPQSYEVWEEKYQLLLLSEKYDELIKHCDKLLENFPNETHVLYAKAFELQRLGKLGEALTCYEKLIRRDKTFREDAENKAEILIKSKKYEEAMKTLDKLLSIRHRIGSINYTSSSRWMPKIYPDYLKVWLLKARAFKGLKRYREAIECYEIVDRMSTNAYNIYELMMKEKRECLHKLAKVKEW